MARFKRCPVCGVSVKLENVERHVTRAHPGQSVDFGLSEEEEAIRVEKRRRPRLRSREKLLYPVLAVVIVVAAVVGVALSLRPQPDSQSGTPAADFVLLSTDDNPVHLGSLKGRVILLDFMDVDCGVCRQETPEVLVPLYASYRNNVTFLSINVGFIGDDDTVSEIVSFKSLYDATWTYLVDDRTVAPKYGVTGTPTTFVLNPDLTIYASFKGRASYESLSAALDGALGD